LSLLFAMAISRNIAGNIRSVIDTTGDLTRNILEGRLSARGDEEKVGIEFKPLVSGVNSIMEAYNKPLEVTVNYVSSISSGKLPQQITDEYKGDFNKIKDGLNLLIKTLGDFSGQISDIYNQHSKGEIEVNLKTDAFQGIYLQMAESVKSTIDYHVTSILKILGIVKSYGVEGDFNKTLEKFPGKQIICNEITEALKEHLQNLINESVFLARSGVEGKLSARGDESKFKGGYKDIVAGINKTLDAVIKPVEEATRCLEAMANGDWSVEMKGDYQGDHAILKNSINATLDSMNEILYNILTSAEQVETGSSQVSDASQSLSQSATEQARSLEEISATVQEINSQSRQNAESAIQANTLAAHARGEAETGNLKMKEMQNSMGEINESAANISKIIKAIDEIAFQTNLLALNAAVEAARAGKHGKGFTVVAEEVRNLAQRSAKAAKETAEMIEGSIKKTDAGTKIANDTASALEKIVSGVTKVTDLIGEISSASKEQENGIKQISIGLGQIDHVTQQNTATAEEAAAASEELSSQAKEMKTMLKKFTLKRNVAASNNQLVDAYVTNRDNRKVKRIESKK